MYKSLFVQDSYHFNWLKLCLLGKEFSYEAEVKVEDTITAEDVGPLLTAHSDLHVVTSGSEEDKENLLEPVREIDQVGDGDDEELSSLAESLLSVTTSTPTPPPEYLLKLQQAEAMILKLQNENVAQRQEVNVLNLFRAFWMIKDRFPCSSNRVTKIDPP